MLVRCEGCQYFCRGKVNHEGLHGTEHGNIVGHWALPGNTQEVQLFQDQTYTFVNGNSALPIMCPMFCQSLGRGHQHLRYCAAKECEDTNLQRHQTQCYGQDLHYEKHEYTCDGYWASIGFKNPSPEHKLAEFAKCPNFCSRDHPVHFPSFCQKALWHAGECELSCNHKEDFRIIFVVDYSGSMTRSDMGPSDTHLQALHPNRLGCALEGIQHLIQSRIDNGSGKDTISVIMFGSEATTLFAEQKSSAALILKGTPGKDMGGTNMYRGLELALGLLNTYQLSTSRSLPIIVPVSDGEDHNQQKSLEVCKLIAGSHPRVRIHPIQFGPDQASRAHLEALAACGNGSVLEAKDLAAFLDAMKIIITQNEASHAASPIVPDKKPEQTTFQAEGPPPLHPWQRPSQFLSGETPELPRWLHENILRVCGVRKGAENHITDVKFVREPDMSVFEGHVAHSRENATVNPPLPLDNEKAVFLERLNKLRYPLEEKSPKILLAFHPCTGFSKPSSVLPSGPSHFGSGVRLISFQASAGGGNQWVRIAVLGCPEQSVHHFSCDRLCKTRRSRV